MNDEIKQARLSRFEERKQNRLERFENLATKANEKSNELYSRSKKMADCIPFGQPILVGHHSEKSDRNFRAKIHNTMGASVKEMQKAEYYENKINSIGKNGISSDDPNAIDKLNNKLKSLQEVQEKMKKANKLIKKINDELELISELVKLGFSETTAKEVITPKYGCAGFPSYRLQNNNAEINRLKKRVVELDALENREEAEQKTDLYTYKECKIENRCMFIFDGKPEEEIRSILKSHGFKWSPSRGAWVRQLNANGIYNSKKVISLLNEI